MWYLSELRKKSASCRQFSFVIHQFLSEWWSYPMALSMFFREKNTVHTDVLAITSPVCKDKNLKLCLSLKLHCEDGRKKERQKEKRKDVKKKWRKKGYYTFPCLFCSVASELYFLLSPFFFLFISISTK